MAVSCYCSFRRLGVVLDFLLLVISVSANIDPLAALSDEFSNPATLSDWKRAYLEDGWEHNLVEVEEIENGTLNVVPFASAWFQNYRGNFYFKEVETDFVVTAKVTATSKTGGIPQSSFSLGGLMARIPNSNFGSWTTGNEFWTFIAMGAGTSSTASEYEVKTTISSQSTLELRTIDPLGQTQQVRTSTLQIARMGNNLVILVKPEGGDWEVFRCYGAPSTGAFNYPQSPIPDAVGPVQVGMNMYSDYNGFIGVSNANEAVARVENADLNISYDWIRFCTPNVPVQFQNTNWFSNCNATKNSNTPNTWTDSCCSASANDMLSFLGDNGFACALANGTDSTPSPTTNPTTLSPPTFSPTTPSPTTSSPTTTSGSLTLGIHHGRLSIISYSIMTLVTIKHLW